MTFGIGIQAKSRFRQRAFFSDTRHRILQHFSLGAVIQDIIDSNDGKG